MADTHTHPGIGSHTHDDATPGHSHDGDATVQQTGTPAEHTHPGTGTHSHDDARPGHDHDYPQETVVSEGPRGGVIARLILGLIGAGGMIVGPLLDWADGVRGTEIEFRAFFSTEAGGQAGFVASAGFTLLVLGVIALIGLAFKSGWLTSLAAGLGILACVLLVITVYRAGAGLGDLGIGFWVAAIGSVLALVASMFGAGSRVWGVRTRTARTV
jgi:hypothetical protein